MPAIDGRDRASLISALFDERVPAMGLRNDRHPARQAREADIRPNAMTFMGNRATARLTVVVEDAHDFAKNRAINDRAPPYRPEGFQMTSRPHGLAKRHEVSLGGFDDARCGTAPRPVPPLREVVS